MAIYRPFVRLGKAVGSEKQRDHPLKGQYEEALSALKKAVEIRPNFLAILVYLAATIFI